MNDVPLLSHLIRNPVLSFFLTVPFCLVAVDRTSWPISISLDLKVLVLKPAKSQGSGGCLGAGLRLRVAMGDHLAGC